MTRCKQCHMDGVHKMSCTDESNPTSKDRAAVPMGLTEPIVEGAYYERDKGGIWGPAELAPDDAPNSGLPMWRGNSVMLYDAYGVPEHGRNCLTRRIYLVPVDPAEVVAGYNDLLAAYSASVYEDDRLRKLFDDAGQGEHNVLALIDHYQRNSMDADERLRAVRKLLEENGCECPCDHHPDERGDECEVCLACRIGEAVGK